MASESTSPADLSAIPSSVSGDGTTFVKGLKKYLEKYDSNVDAKISNIGEGSVNQVTSLRLTEEHRTNASGNVNDIRVEFDTTNVSDYAFAQIWMRKGTNGTWIQQGNTSGVQYVIEDVKADTSNKYYVKVIACNNNAGYSDFATAPMEEITIRGSVLLCNTPTQFYWSREDNKWHWSGYTDNGYTDYFEIRTDQNAGVWNEHRLDSVPAGTYYSTKTPTTRSGIAYLYVRNTFGQYNSPAIHQFSLTAPAKPTKATLEVVTDGVKVTLQGLPSGCTNYVVDVDGVEYEVLSSPWTSYTFFGSITVKYCFVDSVGRGPWSDSNSITTGRLITSTEITDGAISTPKLAANSITAGKIAANTITAGCIASNAITSDKINTGAITATKIATGAITIGGSGREVSIADGAINGSKITAASIIGDKIAANTITASNLKSENIALTGALSITGGGVTLSQNGLRLVGSDNSYTLFNAEGINYYEIGNDIPYAQVKKMVIGTCADGKYVKFKTAWAKAPSNVMCVPMNIQTNDVNHANSDTNIICQARDISRYGFYVDCYLNLGAGSYSYIERNLSSSTTTSTTYNTVNLNFTVYGNYAYNFNIDAKAIMHTIDITTADTSIEMSINATSSMKEVIGYLGYSNANSGNCTAKNSKFAIQICDENMNVLATSSTFNGYTTEGYYGDDGYESYLASVTKNFTLSASFSSGKTKLYVVASVSAGININEHKSYGTEALNMFQSNKQLIAQKVFAGLKVSVPSYKYTSGSNSKLKSGTAMFLVTDGSTNVYDIYDTKPAGI